MATNSPKKTGGKSASSRTSSPKTASAKKAFSGKKRTPKKKKKTGTSRPIFILVVGVCAGMLLFWMGSRFVAGKSLLPSWESVEQTIIATFSSPLEKPQEPYKLPRVKKEPPAKKGTETPPVAQKKIPAQEPKKQAEALQPHQQNAVASALIDLTALPYEESFTASLDDRIRQVDYALMQAAWLKKLPAGSLRLVAIEDRLEGTEPYQYQTIEVLPGASEKDFVVGLTESLNTWAERTHLSGAGQNQWAISIGGVQTHRLILYPGKNKFPEKQGIPPVPQTTRTRQQNETPKMVIVIDDLGANPDATRQLLALDYPVAFAFWPHAKYTREGAIAVHNAGLEVLIHQPMEPLGYPRVKPGPNVLLMNTSESEIRRIVADSITKVPYAIGLNNHMGSRFTQNPEGVRVVLDVLRKHRLFALDSVTHAHTVFEKEAKAAGMENYRRNVFLDVTATRKEILKELERAEKIAILTGQSIAIGHPLPETLAALKEWENKRSCEVSIVRLRDLTQ